MPSDAVSDQARKWFVKILGTEDRASLLPEFHAWLREDPSHRIAYEHFQFIRRLITHAMRAREPGADQDAELQKFHDVWDEHMARTRKEFGQRIKV